MKIGYLLKYARDTQILHESKYETLVDFAKGEYGLDKTQVSRFIAINDRFSEGGYGDRLEEKYQGFGYAKLSVMLTLPEEITEELPAEMTKAEITELKKEVDEENKITDMEVFLEQTEDTADLSEFGRIIHEVVKTYPKIYKLIHQELVDNRMLHIPSVLAPNSKDVYVVRVSGLGKFMVTFEEGKGCTTVNVRNNVKGFFCWQETIEELKKWFDTSKDHLRSWETYFGTREEDYAEEKSKEPQKTAENINNLQKTAENDDKTAENDIKQQKTEENAAKTGKKKPERLHKPEKKEKPKAAEPVKEEPKTEEKKTAAVKETEVEETKVSPSTAAGDFMNPPETEEGMIVDPEEPFYVGRKVEVAPVQQEKIKNADRIIEVTEEFDFKQWGINPDASAEERSKKTQEAFRGVVRGLEIDCLRASEIMKSINDGKAGNYEEAAELILAKIEHGIHDFRMFCRQTRQLVDEIEDEI